MKNILIELILTNQCNKRCSYCDLDFKDKSLSFEDLDLFANFIESNQAKYTINFFWWEALIEFDKLKYFLEKTKKNIYKFSIWTNWILLDREKLDYFLENNLIIYLSVDNISSWKWLNLELFSEYKNIIKINFINDPEFLDNSIKTFEYISSFWFKNIAFMPVFSTKKWNNASLKKLNQIYKYIKNNNWINLETYTYFNWVSIDKQFILDTNLNFYSDLDSLLWLQKQYKNLDISLKEKIENETKICNLKDKNLSLNNLFNSYNIEEILKLVFEIPKKNWDVISYKLIDKILLNGT